MSRRLKISHMSVSEVFPIIFCALVCIILLWNTLGKSILKVTNPQTYTVTVQSKEVKTEYQRSKYLVFTVDSETHESRVFEVTDSIWKGRFDSADVYNMILPEHTYTVKTGGYRIPLFSWYQNIYEVVEIEKEI